MEKGDAILLKLEELDMQYKSLHNHIKMCKRAAPGQIRKEIEAILEENKENRRMMQEAIQNGRSPAITAMSKLQLEYAKKSSAILEALPFFLGSDDLYEKENKHEEEMEASALYAEYAVDFAQQAIRQAILAVLNVVETEMIWKEAGERKDKGLL